MSPVTSKASRKTARKPSESPAAKKAYNATSHPNKGDPGWVIQATSTPQLPLSCLHWAAYKVRPPDYACIHARPAVNFVFALVRLHARM